MERAPLESLLMS